MQVPAMAAMTGLSAASTTRIAVRNVGSAVALGALNSLMSAPPENMFLAPIRMTAFTAASASARSTPATSSDRTSCPSPLTGGLSSVITATGPCKRYDAPIMPPSLNASCLSASYFKPVLAHGLVHPQIVGRALEHDMPLTHYVQAPRNVERDGQFLFDEQDRDAACRDPAHRTETDHR